MPDVVLIDSNIPMYLVGGEHPHKADSVRLLESSVTRGWRLVTDAEVLQEICHRYTRIGRRDAIQPAFDAILGTVDEVLPVARAEAELAKDLLLGLPKLSSRDAIHAAVMKTREVDAIMSFDQGFDSVPGIRRLGAGSG